MVNLYGLQSPTKTVMLPTTTTLLFVFATAASVVSATAQNFTIVSGQIHTPGHVIVNSPQPWTPMGGDDLHISLDITANGQLSFPPKDRDKNKLHTVNVFLTSIYSGLNFTIANSTYGPSTTDKGNILEIEEGSTVKHLNWQYPDCFAESLPGFTYRGENAKGPWNISIHQAFSMKNEDGKAEDKYTVFNLPIMVSNGIEKGESRPTCTSLKNKWGSEGDGRVVGISDDEWPWLEKVEVKDRYQSIEMGSYEWKGNESEEEKAAREEREAGTVFGGQVGGAGGMPQPTSGASLVRGSAIMGVLGIAVGLI